MALISREHIKTLQRLLNLQGADLDVDGIIGPLTKAAIQEFESGGLSPDEPADEPSDDTPQDTDNTIDIKAYEYTRDVVYGETSDEVKQLQAMLKYQGFGKYLGTCGVDGIFGYGTREGIKEYVRGRGLNTKAIEKKLYKRVTKEIWEMFHLEPYDIQNSKWTDEYMKCNCKGKYCDGVPKPYGVSAGVKLLLLRLEDAIKEEYGANAEIGLTDDIGRNGGVRCATWNKMCNGATYSCHIKGIAADGIIKNVNNVNYKRVQEIACKINPYGGCSTKYTANFHIDTRGYISRW